MDAKRIAIVSDSFPPGRAGGVSSAHANLAAWLRGKGHVVRVFTFLDSMSPQPGEDDRLISRHSCPGWLERLLRLAVRLYFRLAQPGLPAYQTAIVLTSIWGGLALRRPLKDFRPDIVVFPDYGAPALMVPRLGLERRVMIAHHNPARFLDLPGVGRYSDQDIRFALKAEQRALATIDKVICPSAYMARCFKESYRFIGPVEVVHNLVDAHRIDALQPAALRERLGLPPDAPLVALPACGNPFKGARHLVEIVRRLTAACPGPIGFLITGSVPELLRDELAYLPERARLHMPGSLDWEAGIALLKACDFAVSPSLVENFSMAGLEAILSGLPLIAFDVGGNTELVANGKSGFTVPYLDIEALLERASSLLDRAELARLRALTVQDAAARLTSDVTGPRYLEALLSA